MWMQDMLRWRRINWEFMSWRCRWSSCWGSVCQRVNQEACRVVETMWTQDAELVWDKLEEQVYTVEKRQEINLGSKFMPWGISTFQEKESVLIDMEVVHIHVPWRLGFQERGDHYKRAMESSVFHKTLAIIIEEGWKSFRGVIGSCWSRYWSTDGKETCLGRLGICQ